MHTGTTDEEQIPGATSLNKRAFNSKGKGNPGRNLDPFKVKILKLAKDYTLLFIKRHLQAERGVKFSCSTIEIRIERWGGTIFKTTTRAFTRSKRNLILWKT
jgi:hypothetical protein